MATTTATRKSGKAGKTKAAAGTKSVTKKQAMVPPEETATKELTKLFREIIAREVLEKGPEEKFAANPLAGLSKGLLPLMFEEGQSESVVKAMLEAEEGEEDSGREYGDEVFGERIERVVLWLTAAMEEPKAAALASAMRHASSLVVPFMRATGTPAKNYGNLLVLVMAAHFRLEGEEASAWLEAMKGHDGSEEQKKKTLAKSVANIAAALDITEEEARERVMGAGAAAAKKGDAKKAAKKKAAAKSAAASDSEASEASDDDDDE